MSLSFSEAFFHIVLYHLISPESLHPHSSEHSLDAMSRIIS